VPDHDHDPEHDEHEHDHDHDGHDHEHDDHDHSLITDRLPEGNWVVDPDSSEVLFKARTIFGLLPVNGVFERFSGEMHVHPDGVAHGTLVVDATSIGTGIGRRDEHLRSDDFLAALEHPQITFTLEKIEPSGEDHLNVSGDLQIRDTTIPLSFTAYAIAHGDHLHLEGRADLDHDQAGLGWTKPGFVGKRVRTEVALTLSRAD
jgi:polyisoprenoid-binding protein YceI